MIYKSQHQIEEAAHAAAIAANAAHAVEDGLVSEGAHDPWDPSHATTSEGTLDPSSEIDPETNKPVRVAPFHW